MSSSLRYQQPDVIEHLASQYVAGGLSAAVRNRVEQLRFTIPALNDAIILWQTQLDPLNDITHEKTAPKQVWRSISAQTQPISRSRLRWWQGAFALNCCLLLVLTFMLGSNNWTASTTELQSAANDANTLSTDIAYIATLSSDDSSSPQWVASVYQPSAQQAAIMALKWNASLSHPREFSGYNTLWSQDAQGNYHKLFDINSTKQTQELSDAQWQMIKQSQHLVVAFRGKHPSEGILFKGKCLQLYG